MSISRNALDKIHYFRHIHTKLIMKFYSISFKFQIYKLILLHLKEVYVIAQLAHIYEIKIVDFCTHHIKENRTRKSLSKGCVSEHYNSLPQKFRSNNIRAETYELLMLGICSSLFDIFVFSKCHCWNFIIIVYNITVLMNSIEMRFK